MTRIAANPIIAKTSRVVSISKLIRRAHEGTDGRLRHDRIRSRGAGGQRLVMLDWGSSNVGAKRRGAVTVTLGYASTCVDRVSFRAAPFSVVFAAPSPALGMTRAHARGMVDITMGRARGEIDV